MPGAVAEDLDAALQGLGARRVAPGEWGLTLEDVGGWPLAMGLRAHRGWLSVQGEVCGPGQVDPHWLLHRGRIAAVGVRYTHTSFGAVWVQLDVPLSDGLAGLVDELLGRVVEAAETARYAASAARRA